MLVLCFHKDLGHQVEGALWQSISFRMAVPPFLAVIWRDASIFHGAEQPDFQTVVVRASLFAFMSSSSSFVLSFLSLPSDKKFQPHLHSLTYLHPDCFLSWHLLSTGISCYIFLCYHPFPILSDQDVRIKTG